MIKGNIQSTYIHQHNTIIDFTDSIYVADYTENTKTLAVKRSVEFFSPNPPTDIQYFSILNIPKLPSVGIAFNNSSFVYANGNAMTQCEGVFFPSSSNSDSWILFCELKYSSKPIRNTNNLRKAINQLFRTQYYYASRNIFSRTNNCYLIASLPIQSEPFTNFSLPQAFLTKLKRTRNIVLRMKNSIEIIDSNLLAV